jgi:hypothetical protein
VRNILQRRVTVFRAIALLEADRARSGAANLRRNHA